MSETVSISTGIAVRYTTAIFELAKEDKALPTIEKDVDALEATLADSADFRNLISSPMYSRGDQGSAVTAIAKKMDLSQIASNLLSLMATKRRLFVLPQMVNRMRELIAQEKGEVSADVIAAKELTKAQQDKLAKTLKVTVGKDVKINLAVDESLIGGLAVKVGSKMIDTSIRSKLAKLLNAMKEVG